MKLEKIMIDQKQQTWHTFNDIVSDIQCTMGAYRFNFLVKEYRERPYLQITFLAPCSITGKMEEQVCRKWILQDTMSTSEVVRTAFKAAKAAYEHECEEEFHYKGVAIYSPHTDVEALVTMRNLEQYSDDVRMPVSNPEMDVNVKMKFEDALYLKTVEEICGMLHVGFRKGLVDNEWSDEMFGAIFYLPAPHWSQFCENLKERLVKDGATVDTILNVFMDKNLSHESKAEVRKRVNKFNNVARQINEENALLILNWMRWSMQYKEI